MAAALRRIGWKVALIYVRTTPFEPGECFDEVLKAQTSAEAHAFAKLLDPRLCHVFSGAVDDLLLRFCADKPSPVVIDMNDVFCPSLFDYLHERFEPTRACLSQADGLCARDLQAKSAQRLDGFQLPHHTLLFPEYSVRDGLHQRDAAPKLDAGEVHVVSVGTFCLESQGMYDSGYLRIAEMLTEQRIHFHIYPHWFYRKSAGSVFNLDLHTDFVDFFRLAERTPYLHIHESLTLDELARELPQYDFGIVAGGCEALGQKLKILKPEYMRTCYSGRIADYLDARLPVLINREVGFNHWLLRRHRVAVELERILEPGFRDYLLALKRDAGMAENAERAAQEFSLDANIGRLAAFYEDVAANAAVDWIRFGSPAARLKRVPVLGRFVRQVESELRQEGRRAAEWVVTSTRAAEHRATIHQMTEEHQVEIGRMAAEHQATTQSMNELRTLLRKQQGALESLQRQLDLASPMASSATAPQDKAPDAHAGPPEAGYRPHSIVHAKLNLELEHGVQWADELAGLLNWPEIQGRAAQSTGMPELLEMVRLFSAGSGTTGEPSSCWQVLGFKNFNQLLSDGYANFKRTIGCNYFNFLVQEGDPQLAFLEANLDEATRLRCAQAAESLPDDPGFTWPKQREYRYFVLMLWEYARGVDRHGYLERLEEPAEGNPLVVPAGSHRASQDLANSVLEYYAMAEGVDFSQVRRTLEIGGGYGRDAFVILGLNPQVQHTVVDIPPALWIAQRYLSAVFPDRSVFPVRDFRSYEEVAEEMERAAIVFLLPHQLELLPARHFDLSINISSFGEMVPEQIEAYLRTLERVTRGHFYMKQWKISQNAFDRLALTEEDYPVSAAWTKVYSRECAVQTQFFEALYRTE